MHYIIYLDVLFVVNFIMDYAVLSITSGILYHTATLPRVSKNSGELLVIYIKRILAAVLGAAWACILLWFKLMHPMWNVVTFTVIGPSMVLIIMGKNKISSYFKGVGIMYMVTFVLGGIMHGIYYYTAFGYFLYSLTKGGRKTASLWIAAAGLTVGYVLVRWFVAFMLEKKKDTESRFTTVIEKGGKSVRLMALCDTGNSLFDPIYGEPVNVAEADALEKLIDSRENTSFHLIPYSSIGKEHGMIPVVRMDKLVLIGKNTERTVINPLFALYTGSFAQRTDYRVILHPDMLCRTKC